MQIAGAGFREFNDHCFRNDVLKLKMFIISGTYEKFLYFLLLVSARNNDCILRFYNGAMTGVKVWSVCINLCEIRTKNIHYQSLKSWLRQIVRFISNKNVNLL